MINLNTFYWILVFGSLVTASNTTLFVQTPQEEKFILVILGWNVALVTLLIGVLFLGLKTYYRFFKDTTDAFGVNMITKRWFKRHYTFNNVGFRDNVDYLLQKDPAKKHRVSFIGDSFTAID